MKSNSYINILLDLPTSEKNLSDVGKYNNRFQNVNVGIRFFTDSSKSKSCFLSFFTHPYIQNHFKMNVFVTCLFLFSGY